MTMILISLLLQYLLSNVDIFLYHKHEILDTAAIAFGEFTTRAAHRRAFLEKWRKVFGGIYAASGQL